MAHLCFLRNHDGNAIGLGSYENARNKGCFVGTIGKGLGKLLFDKVVEVSKEMKVRRMEWQVLDWNQPAIDFYKTFGVKFDDEWVNVTLELKF